MATKQELIDLELRQVIVCLDYLADRPSDDDIRLELRNLSATLRVLLTVLSTQNPVGRRTINGD